MKTKISSKDLWHALDSLRDALSYQESADLFLTYLSAKMIDNYEKDGLFKNEFVSLEVINSYLITKNRELLTFTKKIDDIPDDLQKIIYRFINERNCEHLLESFFLIDFQKVNDKLDLMLSDFEDIINFKDCEKIADIGCSGSGLILHVAINSKYDGEIHLFSENSFNLKMSFVNLFQINKKIILHNLDFKSLKNYDEKFDFILVHPPYGVRQQKIRSLITSSHRMELVYSEFALSMLNKDGYALFAHPYNVFFGSGEFNRFRRSILKNFTIDFLLRVRDPEQPIPFGLILLKNQKTRLEKVLIADLKSLEIFHFIESFLEFLEKGDIETIYSPLIFTIDKKDLEENFAVERLNPIYQDEIRKIERKGFKINELQEVYKIIPGNSEFRRDQYFRERSEGLVPLIRIQDIKDEKVNKDNAVFVDPYFAKRPIFTKNTDILFSVKGTIGKFALVTKDPEKSLVSRSLCILRPRDNKINPKVLMLLLRSKYVSLQINEATTGTIIPYLSIDNLRKLRIPIIPHSKQKEIISRLEQLEIKLSKLQKQQKEVQNEINTILHELVV